MQHRGYYLVHHIHHLVAVPVVDRQKEEQLQQLHSHIQTVAVAVNIEEWGTAENAVV